MNKRSEKDKIETTEFLCDSAKFSILSINDMFGQDAFDYKTMLSSFEGQVEAIQQNDLQCVEKMLISQARTLEASFHQNIMNAQRTKYIAQTDIYMNIAFRAQNLCRKVLSALINLKNPKNATFIKNQNNAINQQINQAQKENLKNFPQKCSNELLSEVHHETLDAGRESSPIGANSSVEAVAKGRGQNSSRKSSEPNERL